MNSDLLDMLTQALGETLYMTAFSSLIGLALGLPLGVVLTVTGRGHLASSSWVNKGLGLVINLTRSFPSIILIIVVLPLSRFLVGTTLGSTAALVPLSLSAAPFLARIIEGSLKEVDKGKIEAALAAGARRSQAIFRVLLPEALPSLIRGITLSVISILGLTAIAGAIGSGGLGSLAIRFGYMRFRDDVMVATVLVLVLLVQIIQVFGDLLARHISKRRHVYE